MLRLIAARARAKWYSLYSGTGASPPAVASTYSGTGASPPAFYYRSARIVTLEFGPSSTARGTLAQSTCNESFAAGASDLEWNHRATEFTEFESSTVDHALVDYEADSFDDLFLTPEASSLQPPVSGLLPIESVPLGARIATKNPRD